jgi:integrase/recombinase XerC
MSAGPLRGGVEQYLASLRHERQLSPHTASGYGRDLASLVDYCESQGITDWNEVDSQHMRMFAAREHRRGLGARSIQRRLSACRGLFRHLLREGTLKSEPTGDVQAPKARKRLPTLLDADSMARLLEFRGSDSLGLRDKAIMELFYSSGLRLSELTGLNLHDLDLRDRTVRVVGKGNKARIVPVGRHAIEALRCWLAERATIAAMDELAVFVGVRGGRLGPRIVQRRIAAGPAGRAGIARPRQHRHHPGLHPS